MAKVSWEHAHQHARNAQSQENAKNQHAKGALDTAMGAGHWLTRAVTTSIFRCRTCDAELLGWSVDLCYAHVVTNGFMGSWFHGFHWFDVTGRNNPKPRRCHLLVTIICYPQMPQPSPNVAMNAQCASCKAERCTQNTDLLSCRLWSADLYFCHLSATLRNR